MDLHRLAAINYRADLSSLHPDALPWGDAVGSNELDFLSTLCGFSPSNPRAAAAYVAKELAQLADIERHVSIVLGLISGSLGGSKILYRAGVSDALMHFAAEEYQHSNMFYRYAGLLAGSPIDASHLTIEARLDVYRGEESLASKLVALISSAYPGESVITAFENRVKHLDRRHRHFFTKMLVAHGLDEARHVDFDHFVFDELLPLLSDAEFDDAKRLLSATKEHNHKLSMMYTEYSHNIFQVDFSVDNKAAEFQLDLTKSLNEKMLSSRSFTRADGNLEKKLCDDLATFSGKSIIHTQKESTDEA